MHYQPLVACIICWHSFTSDSTQTALLSSSFSYKVITSLKFGESRKQSIYSSGGSPIFVRLHMTAQAKQQACRFRGREVGKS